MLVGMLNNGLDNLAWHKVGLVVEVNHTVNLRRIGLGTETGEAGSALGACREKAMLIASVSQASVRGSKQLVNRLESQAGLSDEDGRRLFVEAVCGPDFHEGYRAFLEKRSPDFPTE